MEKKFNILEKLHKQFKKIPKWLQDIISFITSLFSLAGIAYTFAKLLFNLLSEATDNKSPISLSWLICIILLIIIMFMRSKIIQYKINLHIRMKTDAANYYGLLHDFRNFYFDILSYHKNKRLNKDFLTVKTQTYLIQTLDRLCKIYKAYTGSEFNACIKLIGTENENINFDKIDKDNATVYTFVRSSNLSKKREDSSNNKPVLIKKNTDFFYIIDPPPSYNKQYFYEGNLHLFDKELKENGSKYENTTKNYWDFYHAAIVVPIRISHSHLHFTIPTGSYDYHIVGFLCIDTLSTQAFIPEYEEQFIQIAKSFAANIYMVMNKYNFYLQKCKNDYKRTRRRMKNKEGVNL